MAMARMGSGVSGGGEGGARNGERSGSSSSCPLLAVVVRLMVVVGPKGGMLGDIVVG